VYGAEDVREHTPSIELDDAAVSAAHELVRLRILTVTNEPQGSIVESGQEDRTFLRPDDLRELRKQSRIRLVDPDVDLAAARQAHAQREVVGDPVGQEPRLAASQDLPGGFVDLVLDAAAGDRAGELAAFGDRELRADGPRRRSSRRHDAREGHTLAACAPTLEVGQQLPHGSNASRG